MERNIELFHTYYRILLNICFFLLSLSKFSFPNPFFFKCPCFQSFWNKSLSVEEDQSSESSHGAELGGNWTWSCFLFPPCGPDDKHHRTERRLYLLHPLFLMGFNLLSFCSGRSSPCWSGRTKNTK